MSPKDEIDLSRFKTLYFFPQQIMNNNIPARTLGYPHPKPLRGEEVRIPMEKDQELLVVKPRRSCKFTLCFIGFMTAILAISVIVFLCLPSNGPPPKNPNYDNSGMPDQGGLASPAAGSAPASGGSPAAASGSSGSSPSVSDSNSGGFGFSPSKVAIGKRDVSLTNSTILDWETCSIGVKCDQDHFQCCVGPQDYNPTDPLSSKTTCRAKEFCMDMKVNDYQTCPFPTLNSCSSPGFTCCHGSRNDISLTCRPSKECIAGGSSIDTFFTFSDTNSTTDTISFTKSSFQSTTLGLFQPSSIVKCDSQIHQAQEMIVSLSSDIFNASTTCLKQITLQAHNGLSIKATIVDECGQGILIIYIPTFTFIDCKPGGINATLGVWEALQLDTTFGSSPINWSFV